MINPLKEPFIGLVFFLFFIAVTVTIVAIVCGVKSLDPPSNSTETTTTAAITTTTFFLGHNNPTTETTLRAARVVPLIPE